MKKAWKLLRWVVLAVLLLVIGLMLRRPAPVAAPQDPATVSENARSFETKIAELEVARQRGESAEVRLTAEEVNAALQQSAQQTAPAPEGAPPIRTVQVGFESDQVRGQFVTELYGKEVTITLAGRLGARDGYATFAPTEFRVGSLPVPVSMVGPQLQQKLLEPESREKLKLPEFVGDLRIEAGRLVIVER